MSQPAGWYPNNIGQMQYWDGAAWGQVQQTATPPPPPVAGYAPAPYTGVPAYGYGYGGQPALPAALQNAQLATWGTRVGATLLDGLFILFTIGIGWFVNMFLMAREGDKNGMTLGKQALNIRVVKEDGSPNDIGFAFMREFVIRGLLIGFIGGLFFVPPLLDVLWPLWDDKNQTLHDKMVSSYVVTA